MGDREFDQCRLHVDWVHISTINGTMSAAKRPKLSEPTFDPPMSEVRRKSGYKFLSYFLPRFLANLVLLGIFHLQIPQLLAATDDYICRYNRTT